LYPTTDTAASQEKLGKRLFFDRNLSINHTKSCASCHAPELAFSDGYRKSVTALGENLKHNAPSLLNAFHFHFFDWANPEATTLEKQMERPLFGSHPIELGLNAHWKEVEYYLLHDSLYQQLLQTSFPDGTLSLQEKMIQAIASFEKTLISEHSVYDDYVNGNAQALPTPALRGMKLFFGEKMECFKCHVGKYFTNAAQSNNPDSVYFNIGLYNENHSYPLHDLGLMEYTGKAEDNGKFKVPSLRNVALTAPYMHDGSVATLSEVIDIYAHGGRVYNQQDGSGHPNKHTLIHGFEMTNEEKNDLLAFLQTLSDTNLKHPSGSFKP